MTHLAGASGGSWDWRDRAACRHHDPDLFFPEGTGDPVRRQVDQAKLVCQSCPVQTQCLSFALRHSLAHGIWGGATGEERHALRSRRRIVLSGSLD